MGFAKEAGGYELVKRCSSFLLNVQSRNLILRKNKKGKTEIETKNVVFLILVRYDTKLQTSNCLTVGKVINNLKLNNEI